VDCVRIPDGRIAQVRTMSKNEYGNKCEKKREQRWEQRSYHKQIIYYAFQYVTTYLTTNGDTSDWTR